MNIKIFCRFSLFLSWSVQGLISTPVLLPGVATQMQWTNISYHIISYHIISYHTISYHISYHIIYHTVKCKDPIQSSREFLKLCLYREHGQQLCSLLYLLYECQVKNRARCGTSSFSQLLVGIGLLTVEASRSNSDTPHSEGLLWTSDQPVAETSTWQRTTLTRDKQPCPRRDSKPKSPQAKDRRTPATFFLTGYKFYFRYYR
jgi:hypothetical protein